MPSIGASFVKDFQSIGTTKAGCIIGEYANKQKHNAYIVWIDSEGEPNFPLAKSIEEYFSIIPWGTGFIYDVAFKFLMNSKDFTEPQKDTLVFDEYEKMMGIKINSEPETVIQNAIKRYKKELESLIDK